jgi:hypothetical protein
VSSQRQPSSGKHVQLDVQVRQNASLTNLVQYTEPVILPAAVSPLQRACAEPWRAGKSCPNHGVIR